MTVNWSATSIRSATRNATSSFRHAHIPFFQGSLDRRAVCPGRIDPRREDLVDDGLFHAVQSHHKQVGPVPAAFAMQYADLDFHFFKLIPRHNWAGF